MLFTTHTSIVFICTGSTSKQDKKYDVRKDYEANLHANVCMSLLTLSSIMS
jgi:hypothetical protein